MSAADSLPVVRRVYKLPDELKFHTQQSIPSNLLEQMNDLSSTFASFISLEMYKTVNPLFAFAMRTSKKIALMVATRFIVTFRQVAV